VAVSMSSQKTLVDIWTTVKQRQDKDAIDIDLRMPEPFRSRIGFAIEVYVLDMTPRIVNRYEQELKRLGPTSNFNINESGMEFWKKNIAWNGGTLS
jgi:hypothetical protein